MRLLGDFRAEGGDYTGKPASRPDDPGKRAFSWKRYGVVFLPAVALAGVVTIGIVAPGVIVMLVPGLLAIGEGDMPGTVGIADWIAVTPGT